MEPARIPWSKFQANFKWKQGQHVSLIGPTGSGKTTLAIELLLHMRGWVVALECKPRDKTMQRLIREQGYKRQKAFIPDIGNRLIVWPKMRSFDDLHTQRDTFLDTLSEVYGMGGWCLYLDELSYLTDLLSLDRMVRMLYQSARSTGVSIVAGTQRPAFVPLAMYDQATWLFFWSDNDERNLKRIGNIGGMASRPIRTAVANLEEHEVLCLNTRTKSMCITLPEIGT